MLRDNQQAVICGINHTTMKLANRLKLIIFATAALALSACGEDKSPLSLADVKGSALALDFPHLPYTYVINGGDGTYSAASGNDRILHASVSGSKLTLTTQSAGTTEITVRDGSGQTLRMPVTVETYRQRLVVEKLYARASGEKLDPSDKATIEARALETIPMAPGGGFDFTYTGYSAGGNPCGNAMVYPERYGEGSTAIPFEYRSFVENKKTVTCYILTIEGRERIYRISRYNGRSEVLQEMALTEDVTDLFAADYPEVESVYTQMSVSQPEH